MKEVPTSFVRYFDINGLRREAIFSPPHSYAHTQVILIEL